VREFRIDVPESELTDLRDRLARTRWPEAATVDGWTQGVPVDYARELCEYWASAYDWRRCEAELNALPQYLTSLDGGGGDSLDIHFIHARSRHENAMPLLLTHGWPGSVIEYVGLVNALTDPADPADAFHLVIPSLPGFGFSGKPTVAGWNVERIAAAWAQLMDRLGYERYAASGGDWGSIITPVLAGTARENVIGIHLTMPLAPIPHDFDITELSATEQEGLRRRQKFDEVGRGYSAEQSTRPQTLGYGLVDSPAAQCAWIVEKFWEWTDCAGHPENVITRDRMLDNVMLYWLPGTGASSARIYWESFKRRPITEPVDIPTGVTLFPMELARLPRKWVAQRFTDIRHWSEPKVGGHFGSLEQPAIFIEELRTFFRPLRQG
jgi:epoxide hydrolase